MVKLIAADMDGTLLDDQKRLPNGFPKLLECLHLPLQAVVLIRHYKCFSGKNPKNC